MFQIVYFNNSFIIEIKSLGSLILKYKCIRDTEKIVKILYIQKDTLEKIPHFNRSRVIHLDVSY